MDNKEFSKELKKGLDDLVNYLLFSHLLEQSKLLTLVTLGILHFRHFGCGYAALGFMKLNQHYVTSYIWVPPVKGHSSSGLSALYVLSQN